MRPKKRRKKLEGNFDGFSLNRLRGWVADNGDRENPVSVDVFANGLLVGTFAANIYRVDLARAGKARQGACAFDIEFHPSKVMEQATVANLKVEIFISGPESIKLGEQVFPDGSPVTFDISRGKSLLQRIRQVVGRREWPIMPPVRQSIAEAVASSLEPACVTVELPSVPEQVLKLESSARVFQFHSGSSVGDAVTNSLFYIQSILADFGIGSKIFVEHRDPRLADRLGLIHEFVPKEDDLLIIHHSMGHDIMPMLQKLKCRKVLLYHNITPPSFFTEGSPFRHYALQGLKQLEEFSGMIDDAIADSAYNARELTRRGYEDVKVIPLLKDFAPLRSAPYNPAFHYFNKPRYQILFVGRICANKGQLNLVRFMDQYADRFDYPLHLTLIGHFDHSEGYAARLLEAIEASAFRDRIHVVGHVSDQDLFGYYRAADVYLSLSEHEGFGVPLLEAMTFDVPVVALAGTAVGETLGSAGIKLGSTSPEEIAEALDPLLYDRSYRRKVIRRQRERLRTFDRNVLATKLLDFLLPHLPAEVVVGLDPICGTSPDQHSNISRQFIIEGPCETSYSLAIVNRNLGIALGRIPGIEAALVPAEGIPGYVLDTKGLNAHPEIEPLLGMPATNSEAAVVSIRNMYPLRPAGMLGDLRLAFFFWEESDVPNELVQLINRYLDGVIVASEFGQRICRNSGIRTPIAVCGCGLDPRDFSRRKNGLSRRHEDPFTFLHVSSGMARKGVEELLSAYVAAFSGSDNVELIIKTYRHPNNIVEVLYEKIVKGSGHEPAVKILFEDLTDEEMARLYSAADVMVLPTRGEGFNLPAAEALFLGIPLITTRHSAHLDFCNDNNTILLDYVFESSESHLRGGESMWVRPNVSDLAVKMRSLFRRAAKNETEARVADGMKTASDLTWDKTAAAVSLFVDDLVGERKQMPKLKLAWVSTWNTRCGIASYSEHLISNLAKDSFEIDIFANHLKDQRSDASNVVRCWTDRNGSLDQLVENILRGGYDVAVFQYNYGFQTIEQLGTAVSRLEAGGVDTHVFFHKTAETTINGIPESIAHAAGSLARATRLVVHSIEDVNRLKCYGLINNVVKIPQGALSPVPMKYATVRQLLRLDGFTPIVGSFGFMLPKKGIPELILAFSMLLRRHYPKALLLLLNSQFPDPLSEAERVKCVELIESLGIKNNVILISDYLEIDEALLLLSAADCVVFPYQDTKESSSAAVRQGISSLRPVLTTPLAIFDDVADCVQFLPGASPQDIADGVHRLLEEPDACEHLSANQAKWLSEHNWPCIGQRLSNMILGLYEDRHGAAVTGARTSSKKSVEAPPALPDMVQNILVGLQAEEFVRIAFHRVLGRDADRDEVRTYGDLLQNRLRTKAEIVDEIMAKDETREYRAKMSRHGDGNHGAVWTVSFADLTKEDDEFVFDVYYKLLMRPPTQTEYAALIRQIRSGSVTRRDVVDQILALDEFVQNDLPILVV
ncbi:glycosyltransferase [Methylosinus sp. H3A]|uniref:glycosyltransferase family 4 protein n=1 Tax=Methylosinus sp. H3A TaxID=2785786 RepID=UPI0018C1EBD2|nr:glycosyltransferase [Methylosinus sp. H3A]MBG0807878.1 glycosyltransferase [Methylosinus sp. H3A]